MSATMSPVRTRELKSALSFEMVPETCEPTCTVRTALSVPVASTTSRISPRSTFAVTYCTLPPPLNEKSTTIAVNTIAPAT